MLLNTYVVCEFLLANNIQIDTVTFSTINEIWGFGSGHVWTCLDGHTFNVFLVSK